MTIRLTILGPPRTKANLSSSVWSKKSKRMVTFKNAEVEAYELGIAGQARSELRAQGYDTDRLPVFDGAVEAWFRFYFPRRPTNSDTTNYFKSVCDALNGVAWLDDRQIVRVHGEKHHDKMRPRIEIEVAEVTREA